MRRRPWPQGQRDRHRVFVVTIMAALVATACGTTNLSSADRAQADSGPTSDHGSVEGPVLVFAAASLSDAFAGMAVAFETANPGVDIELNLAGSSSLREQILEGAPADVFASADEATMSVISENGLVAEPAEVFATNQLQIAVPAGNPGAVSGLEDFADDDLLNGLCAAGVPCGDFARQVLANAGVDAAIDTNEPDVRSLLTKIAADELDAGIVYLTDVAITDGEVEGIEIPAEVNVQATYPIAELAGSTNQAGAEAFVTFVLSAEGQAIMTGHGFLAP